MNHSICAHAKKSSFPIMHEGLILLIMEYIRFPNIERTIAPKIGIEFQNNVIVYLGEEGSLDQDEFDSVVDKIFYLNSRK